MPFLHFELCYYQAIEHAIAWAWPGWRPAPRASTRSPAAICPPPVYSAHWIADPALRRPSPASSTQERAAVTEEMEWLEEEYSPFKQG